MRHLLVFPAVVQTGLHLPGLGVGGRGRWGRATQQHRERRRQQRRPGIQAVAPESTADNTGLDHELEAVVVVAAVWGALLRRRRRRRCLMVGLELGLGILEGLRGDLERTQPPNLDLDLDLILVVVQFIAGVGVGRVPRRPGLMSEAAAILEPLLLLLR